MAMIAGDQGVCWCPGRAGEEVGGFDNDRDATNTSLLASAPPFAVLARWLTRSGGDDKGNAGVDPRE